jgi:Mg2+ and Co2+ transporter CorA
MKHILKLIIIGVSILLTSGCGDSSNRNNAQQDQEESQQSDRMRTLEQKTMAVHDSIMPQMDSLMRLKKRLQSRLEQQEGAGSQQKVQAQVDSLAAVREGMMNWMSRYSKEYKRLPDTTATSVKAKQLKRLNQDIHTLKKRWDQTLRNSVELLKQE